ncbi:hypothetical protein [Acinetobacter sp. CFCC 10889]|uniref:hypothetical protein n=1 Tax=Acinetobacter sp. CFCC 10889 TaxID=1775557 RepID=UPI000DCFD7C5|nr:hypothetical protein [Acinetobacter sp. CFCC 10889]
MEDIDSKVEQLKRDLYSSISKHIHLFEAETGQTINDIELVFLPIGTVDEPHKHLLNEIHIGLVDKDDMPKL